MPKKRPPAFYMAIFNIDYLMKANLKDFYHVNSEVTFIQKKNETNTNQGVFYHKHHKLIRDYLKKGELEQALF